MRIMMVLKFPIYGGGSGTQLRNLAKFFAKRGHKVAIVAPDKRQLPNVKTYTIKPVFKAVFESHPEWKRAKKYSNLTGEEFARQYAAFHRQITQAVADFKPDVIHIHHASFLTWIASFIKSMFGIAYVVTAHGTGIYNATIDRRYLVLTRQALERAETIIAVSHHTRKWLTKVFGRKLWRKTRVITSGVDLALYPGQGSFSQIEKKYNLKGKKVIIFVGRLTKEKGVEYLLRAAAKVRAEFYIIGSGNYRDYLVNYAKLLGLKNVHFLGYFGKEYLKELRQFYYRADALVLPSVVDESLGLVVLEAMACGTPVVASNKGGIPLVVKDGVNGFLVRARSAKAIAGALKKILNDPILKERLVLNARKIVEERFDWQVIVPQIENLYERAAETTGKLQKTRIEPVITREELQREKEELTQKIGYVA